MSIGNLIAAACMLTAIMVAYVAKRARPVYLLDFHVFKPADELKMTHEVFLQRTRLCEVRGMRAGLPPPPRLSGLPPGHASDSGARPASRALRARAAPRRGSASHICWPRGQGGAALTAAGRRAARRASRPPAWPSRRRWWPRAAWATRPTCRTVRARAPRGSHTRAAPLLRPPRACPAGRRCRRPACVGAPALRAAVRTPAAARGSGPPARCQSAGASWCLPAAGADAWGCRRSGARPAAVPDHGDGARGGGDGHVRVRAPGAGGLRCCRAPGAPPPLPRPLRLEHCCETSALCYRASSACCVTLTGSWPCERARRRGRHSGGWRMGRGRAARARAGGHPDRQLLAVQPDAVAGVHGGETLPHAAQRHHIQPQRHGLQRRPDCHRPRAGAAAGARAHARPQPASRWPRVRRPRRFCM